MKTEREIAMRRDLAAEWHERTALYAQTPGLPEGWAEAIAVDHLPDEAVDDWPPDYQSLARLVAAEKLWIEDRTPIVALDVPANLDVHAVCRSLLEVGDGAVAWSETHVYVYTYNDDRMVGSVDAYPRNPPAEGNPR